MNKRQAAVLQNWADMSGGEVVPARTLRVGDAVVGRVTQSRHTVASARWDWSRQWIEVYWENRGGLGVSTYRPDDSLVVIRGE